LKKITSEELTKLRGFVALVGRYQSNNPMNMFGKGYDEIKTKERKFINNLFKKYKVDKKIFDIDYYEAVFFKIGIKKPKELQ